MADSPKVYENDISAEAYREYVMQDGEKEVVYRIDKPRTLFIREGGSTHRVLDSEGVVHLVPGPGYRGTAIRWKPADPNKPVQF